MPAIAAVATLVGAGISAYGAITSGNDQAQLDTDRANIAKQQATELQSREIQNEAIVDQTATRQKLQFGASYAASGKAGTGVGSQLQIQNQADLQNMVTNRESQFQQTMLQEQAGIDTTLAGQAQASGTIGALSAGLRGVAGAAGIGMGGGNNPGYGGIQSLGLFPATKDTINSNVGLGAGAFGGR